MPEKTKGVFLEKQVSEGGTLLIVPDVSAPEEGNVFYNPVQSLSRDFSVCVYSFLKPRTLCDPLSGTGARGIRIAKEVQGISVTCGDLSARACEAAKRNAELNGISVQSPSGDSANSEGVGNGLNMEIVRENANALMSSRCWDAVDIDPFGSPVPFLDLAARSAGKILAITATDPAALCGVYPRVSLRKYLAKTVKTEFYHEVGIRVLAGFAIRMAAKYECALRPIICHSSNHYYRIYFEKGKGAGRADKALSSLGFLYWCQNCTFREVGIGVKECPFCAKETLREIGPLYIGELFDRAVCEGALAEAKARGFSSAQDLLEKICKEAPLPAFHYDHHALSSFGGFGPEKLESFLSRLRSFGNSAERTHFSETGFRTDAGFARIAGSLKGGNK